MLVAEDEKGITGFATFGDFRPWPCYRHTVEHSVHIRHDVRGKGLGGQFIRALLDEAASRGKHVMIGGIDAGQCRFHRAS